MDIQELQFIEHLLNQSLNIDVSFTHNPSEFQSFFAKNLDSTFTNTVYFNSFIEKYQKRCKYQGVYSLITNLNTYFLLICLTPDCQSQLLIGPFIEQEASDPFIYEIVKQTGIDASMVVQLKKYYMTIPILELSHISTICYTIAKHLFSIQVIPDVDTFDLRNQYKYDNSLLKDYQLSIYLMEERYNNENLFLKAVSEGNITEAYNHYKKLKSQLPTLNRTKDLIRNHKNSAIILNTLLRKSAEEGGVHPIYLDEISNKWAITLETLTTPEKVKTLAQKMILDYCLLVKNQSLKEYSPIVRQAMNYIHLNLSTEITVSFLATLLSITPDYLVRLFRKELQTTVIDYINHRRINTSLKLLATTDMHIQDIANHVGILDLSYFGRLFRKYIGMSPTQYRESL